MVARSPSRQLRSGTWETWSSNSDGSHPSQLTSLGGPFTYAPRWSPDGKRLSFVSNASGRPAIFVIASAGGAPQVLTTRDSADAMPGSWSRDGKWIYYTSEDLQVWRVPSNGGTPVQLTLHGG